MAHAPLSFDERLRRAQHALESAVGVDRLHAMVVYASELQTREPERAVEMVDDALRRLDAGPGTAVGLFTAAFVVGALPADWMGEQRFASPLVVLGGSLGALAVGSLARAAIDRRRGWLTTMTAALLWIFPGGM